MTGGFDFSTALELGRHEGGELGEVAEAHALVAFGEDEEALVRHLDDFVDGRAGADVVEVGGLRGVQAGVALGDDENGLLFAQRLDELDGAFAADGEGQHGMGKQHGVAHRENRRGPLGRGRLAGLFAGACGGRLDDAYEIAWH